MEQSEMLVTVGDWVAHFGFAGILLFTLGYAIFARWWRSGLGRNVMALAVTHVVAFGLIVAQIDFGTEWNGRPWVRALVFASIAMVYWWRLLILVVDQVLAPPAGGGAPPGALRRVCGECGK